MSVLIPGKTCWRTERSDRAAFLVDNEAYFTALYEAIKKARRSILILGWGFDPRARFFPDGYDGPDDPDEVGHVLLRLAAERPELDVRLLIWKSALPIAASQEFFPHKARKWFEGTPIKFHLDDQVPLGACHHQKVVVVDDRLAFCGGGDIAVDRWDSQGHLDDDQRRIMPDQQCHAPRHEVMMMVDGEAARTLGDHFRRALAQRGDRTRSIDPPPDAGGDPWPDHVPAHLIQDAQVSIARTTPALARPRLRARRSCDLTLACIADAKETIYLENQYFTSPRDHRGAGAPPGRARRARGDPDHHRPGAQLVRPADHGPCAALDGPGACRPPDIFGRFRAFYPTTPSGRKIIVHSKTSIFDDRIVRVGSANLNNRGMASTPRSNWRWSARTRRPAPTPRCCAIGWWGTSSATVVTAVGKARVQFGGLVHAIDNLNRAGRLTPIDCSPQSKLAEFIATYHLGDPADVVDAWRPWKRRDRLYVQARNLAPLAARRRVR